MTRRFLAKELSQESKKVKFLVYGASGVGKTVSAAMLPKPIFLLTELQAASQSIAPINPDAVIYPIQSIADMKEVINELHIAAQKKTPGDDVWVVWDSLSDFGEMVKYEIRQRNGDRPLTIGDWGVAIDTVMLVARMIRDLPYHVLILARVKETFQENVVYYRPEVIGQDTAQNIAALMTLVGYFYLTQPDEKDKQAKRLLLLQSDATHLTKGHALLRSVEYPNYIDLANRILGGKIDKSVIEASLYGKMRIEE